MESRRPPFGAEVDVECAVGNIQTSADGNWGAMLYFQARDIEKFVELQRMMGWRVHAVLRVES